MLATTFLALVSCLGTLQDGEIMLKTIELNKFHD
jgi:hypothetical protein